MSFYAADLQHRVKKPLGQWLCHEALLLKEVSNAIEFGVKCLHPDVSMNKHLSYALVYRAEGG